MERTVKVGQTAPNASGDPLQLDEAVFSVLLQEDSSLLENSYRFINLLADFADMNSREGKVLRLNCDNSFLAPFSQLINRGGKVTDKELDTAMEDAASYLVAQRGVDKESARSTTIQIARGLFLYLQNLGRGDFPNGYWPGNENTSSGSESGSESESGSGSGSGPGSGPKTEHLHLRTALVAAGVFLFSIVLGVCAYYSVFRGINVSVSFDGNGADSGTMAKESVLKGDRFELPNCDYSRDGYSFAGWRTKEDENSLLQQGDSITVSKDTTLYAIWYAGVSFNGNGATSGKTKTVYADKNGDITLPDCGFSKEGCTFKEWTDSSESKYYQPGDVISQLDRPIVLYARWEKNSYKIPLIDPDETGPDEYVLADTPYHRYTYEEANTLTDKQLYYARTEIFARYGKGMLDPSLVDYFNSKTWYRQTMTWEQWNDTYQGAESYHTPCNDIEKSNWQLFYSIEKDRNSPYLNDYKAGL